MAAAAEQSDRGFVEFVDEQQVRKNVAIPNTLPLPVQLMSSILAGKGSLNRRFWTMASSRSRFAPRFR